MTTDKDRASAKIYRFPARGRFAPKPADGTRVPSFAVKTTACGSSWYHDDAIREEERERTD